MNILIRGLVNDVLFFQKVVFSIAASDEICAQIYPLAHATLSCGHEH